MDFELDTSMGSNGFMGILLLPEDIAG